MGRGFVAVALMCALWVTATPAEAQGGVEYTLAVQVTAAGTPIQPITGGAAVPFDVVVTCGLAEHDFLEHATLTFTASSDAPWATVVPTPSTWDVEYHMEDCAAGVPREMNGTVSIQLSKDAVAGEPIPLRLTATLEEFEEVTVHWNETVAPYMRTQVRFEEVVFKVAPGGDVEIPTTVHNLGNGPVKVSMTTYGNTSADLTVTKPGVLEVPAQEKTTFKLVVKAPGTVIYTNERHELHAEFVATSVLDETVTEGPHRVIAAIQVQGSVADEADVPDVPSMPVVLALAALALFARRRLVQQ